LEAWPDVAESAGLAGTKVASAVIDAWGWTARIALPRGRTAAQVVAAVPAIESGLGIAPGKARAQPDPHRADRAYLRVLDKDPHLFPIPYARPAPGTATIARPVPLGLWDDGTTADVLLLRRNTLVGGIIDSGKSGLLNVIMAYLVACPDVLVWGIDLKGGMELHPWAGCMPKLATTPEQATNLLAAAAEEITIRAVEQVQRGERLWQPDYDRPALLILIDEYAELPDQALTHADTVARLGRAVAVNLLAATQRPTQKAMGGNAVRSQMDIRISLRVRERRDVDLILGQGMLAAGWHAHTLDAPGKFLISAREPAYRHPRPARAYLITDQDVAGIAAAHARYTDRHPTPTPPHDQLPDSPPPATASPASGPAEHTTDAPAPAAQRPPAQPTPEDLLWAALSQAPDDGIPASDLTAATGRNNTWIYRRLRRLKHDGQVTSPTYGRWRTTRDIDAA
jgi:S-DNA-T family DNA segregation ATPase FtsK/SpoIIIE